MKRVVILGSTGSIGTQTLAVMSAFLDCFKVEGLSAANNMTRLAEQIRHFKVQHVSVKTPEKAAELVEILRHENPKQPLPEILIGQEGLCTLASLAEVDTVVVGLSGFCGLTPTLEALQAGKTVLTANKETFVAAGHLVQPYLQQIVPLDSEHSAIFQCLQGTQRKQSAVRKLYLTASGGPFLTWTPEMLAHVTPGEALQHPNWQMGPKITVDSATMMNKGLEIIEAHHLFGIPFQQIDVVIHQQSIVHSAVAFVDGSILAQMGQPDMRVPLQYGLTFPDRWTTPFDSLHLDLTEVGRLDFQSVDPMRFPALSLARQAGEAGGTMPTVLNACDEVAVQLFLEGRIAFTEIPCLIETGLKRHEIDYNPYPDLDEIIAVDQWARHMAQEKYAMLSA